VIGLDYFYKLGALGALMQQVAHAAPGAAQTVAKKELNSLLRGETRELLGLEAPEWRRGGGLMDIPALAAQKVKAVLPGAVPAPLPEPVEKMVEKAETVEETEKPEDPEKPTKPEEKKPDKG
jgi:hypothetical protein